MKKKQSFLLIIFIILLGTESCKQFEKIPYVKTKSIETVDATGGVAIADILDLGEPEMATEYGWCFDTQTEPTIDKNKINNGTRNEVGEFNTNIVGLQPNTKYYIRPYIITDDKVTYGEQLEITTKELTFEITYPKQGEILGIGFDYDITWTANISDNIKIELLQGTIIAETIAEDIENTGTYNWTVSNSLPEATDYTIKISSAENDNVSQITNIFSLSTEAPPSVSTDEITDITYYTATAKGTINNFGLETSATQHGHCWSTSPNPTIANSKTQLGSTSSTGSFTSSLTNLTQNTTYYVRAYATNSVGTSYGDQKTFTTDDAVTPTVTTNNVTNISYTTATCGGNVTNGGSESVTARGVCWSTSSSPTTSNFHTTDGSGTGSFTSSLTNLTQNTTYYVRAYATNSVGTSYGNQKTFTTDEIPVFTGTMINVTGGSFQMGCGTGQSNCYDDETPVHTVSLDNFSISKYEITNQQYADFLNAYGSSTVLSGEHAGQTMINESSGDYDWGLHNNSGTWQPVSGYENYPVIDVTWYGAYEFCLYYGGRLPTEAEWEYAARGGTNYTNYYLYSGSNTIGDVAWYYNNSSNHTHEVGTKSPNSLGIYDMSGNVYEWCSDWYQSGYYSSSPSTNPTGPSSGSRRVLRGGSWSSDAEFCRVAYRRDSSPASSGSYLGFRVARSL